MGNSLVDTVNAIIAPLRRKADLMIARAVIRSTKYDQGLQYAQLDLLADETKDAVQHMQEYGFASAPDADADAIAVFVGGERMHGVVIATDDSRHRPEVEPGEAAVYTKFGDIIKLTKDGEILITSTNKVIVTAPDIEIEGDLAVNGNIDSTGDITAAGDISDTDRTLDDVVTAYNTPHTHVAPAGGGTTTGVTPAI